MLPVAAPVVVVRAAALHALGTLFAAPDDCAAASLVHQLTAVGRVEPVAEVVVQDVSGFTRGSVPAGTAPELTIVVPTLDATSARLRACVRSLHDTPRSPYEIVVVDNGAPAAGLLRAGQLRAPCRARPLRRGLQRRRRVLAGWWEPLRDGLEAWRPPVVFPMTVHGAMRPTSRPGASPSPATTSSASPCSRGSSSTPSSCVWYQDTDLLTRLRELGEAPVLVPTSTIVPRPEQSPCSAPDPAAARVGRDRRRAGPRRPSSTAGGPGSRVPLSCPGLPDPGRQSWQAEPPVGVAVGPR